MKKKNLINKDLVLVIIFICFLTVPNIFYWFLKDSMDNTNYENRELYTKPIFSLKNIETYALDYENYFNDHLAFKNEILKCRATILYNLFQTSASEKVIVGEDGWLFYNSVITESPNNSVEDYQQINSYSEQDMLNMKMTINSDIEKFNEKNIEYYILVGPNKEIVYSDYMPKLIKRNNDSEISRTEKLVQYLQENSNINIIYPKEILTENRRNENTYFKYDTHWNNYGAYLGTMELMKMIKGDVEENDISFDKTTTTGDLAIMNLMSKSLMHKEPDILNFYDHVEYTCEEDTEFKNCFSENAKYDETILVVGDSFRNAMAQYFSKLYKHAIIVHRNYYNPNMIEEYQPDTVVNITVERGSSILLSPLIY